MEMVQDPLNLIICGVGGQGNILIASILAASFHQKGYRITVGDTFGAAQRGGAVFSSLRVSARKLYGPLIPSGKAHIILGLEPLETLRLLIQYGNPEIVCITNISPIYPVGVIAHNLRYPNIEELKKSILDLSKSAHFIDAADMARRLGLQISMNMIMLGILIASGLLPVKKEDVLEEMKRIFPPVRLPANLQAFELGIHSIASETEIH